MTLTTTTINIVRNHAETIYQNLTLATYQPATHQSIAQVLASYIQDVVRQNLAAIDNNSVDWRVNPDYQANHITAELVKMTLQMNTLQAHSLTPEDTNAARFVFLAKIATQIKLDRNFCSNGSWQQCLKTLREFYDHLQHVKPTPQTQLLEREYLNKRKFTLFAIFSNLFARQCMDQTSAIQSRIINMIEDNNQFLLPQPAPFLSQNAIDELIKANERIAFMVRNLSYVILVFYLFAIVLTGMIVINEYQLYTHVNAQQQLFPRTDLKALWPTELNETHEATLTLDKKTS